MNAKVARKRSGATGKCPSPGTRRYSCGDALGRKDAVQELVANVVIDLVLGATLDQDREAAGSQSVGVRGGDARGIVLGPQRRIHRRTETASQARLLPRLVPGWQFVELERRIDSRGHARRGEERPRVPAWQQ